MKHGQYRFFQLHEFDSPDKKGSGKNMQPLFLKKLDKARRICEERYNRQIKFVITSGFRTYERHSQICKDLGLKRYQSQHELGLAADISAPSSREMYAIVEALLLAGFVRIGIAEDFVHVDMGYSGNDQMNRLIWTY